MGHAGAATARANAVAENPRSMRREKTNDIMKRKRGVLFAGAPAGTPERSAARTAPAMKDLPSAGSGHRAIALATTVRAPTTGARPSARLCFVERSPLPKD